MAPKPSRSTKAAVRKISEGISKKIKSSKVKKRVQVAVQKTHKDKTKYSRKQKHRSKPE